MAMLKIFKSHVPSISYFFKNGLQAAFIGGKFATDRKEQIDELMAEVVEEGAHKSKHPHIYIDPNEKELDTDAPSPIEQLKADMYAKAKADILAEQARAMDADNNVSSSDSDPKKFALSLNNSKIIADAMASSDGTAVASVPTGSLASAVAGSTMAAAGASAVSSTITAKLANIAATKK